MATVNYKSAAEYLTHTVSVALSGVINAGDYFEVSCNNKAIRYTFTGTETFDDAINSFVALWQDNQTATEPMFEFAEVTAANAGSNTITFTHNTPGVKFTYTYTGSGLTATPTTTVTATGPEDASNTANYDIGALPSAGDTLVIPAGTVISDGLTALAALAIGYRIYTAGKIGLPAVRVSEGASGGYPEYRTRALQINNGASLETLIDCESQFIYLNGLAVQCTLRVLNTGSPLENDQPAVLFIGTHASNAINVTKGYVGTCFYAGETATVATLSVTFLDQAESDAVVRIGYGTTLTTINQTGGQVTCYVAYTTLNKYDGTFTQMAGAPTTINNYKGTVNYRGGNCTTYKAYPQTVNNFYQNPSAKTFTNTTVYEGAEWHDEGATITHSNTISVPGGSPTGIKGSFGAGRASAVSFGA